MCARRTEATTPRKSEILNSAEAVFAAGRAGVQILSKAQIAQAKKLLIAADVNAVPPSGIEGLEVNANGEELSPGGALGIGALAIGGIKYQTEFGLFQKMIDRGEAGAVRFPRCLRARARAAWIARRS